MKSWISILAAVAAFTVGVHSASAAVDVERHGTENPVIEIAKSTTYGALAGMTVGLAIELAQDDSDSDAIRWGTVIGTFAGLAGGIYFVATRPSGGALLEIENGKLGIHPLAAVDFAPSGGVKVRLAGVAW